jgi:polar amino acid transport system substrate-binding protein
MPNRPWFTWTKCCAAALLVWSAVAVNAETLLVYGDDSYPPVIYSDNGKPTGVLVDILRKVSARTGDTYEVRVFPWKRAYEHARAGRAAVVGVSKTTDRMAEFDFSDAIYFDDIQIVVKRGREFPYAQLGDLKGKTVGGVLGASYGNVVDAAIKDGLFKMDQDTGQKGRLHKVLLDRVDAAFIGNGAEGFDMVVRSDPELQARRAELVVLGTPLTRDPLHLAVAKSMNKKALIERFNIALREVQKVTVTQVPGKDHKAKN